MAIRIACTALAKRIVVGTVSKDGLSFTGEPKDVTSDCLKAVIDFVGDAPAVVTENGKPAYEITVKKL